MSQNFEIHVISLKNQTHRRKKMSWDVIRSQRFTSFDKLIKNYGQWRHTLLRLKQPPQCKVWRPPSHCQAHQLHNPCIYKTSANQANKSGPRLLPRLRCFQLHLLLWAFASPLVTHMARQLWLCSPSSVAQFSDPSHQQGKIRAFWCKCCLWFWACFE